MNNVNASVSGGKVSCAKFGHNSPEAKQYVTAVSGRHVSLEPTVTQQHKHTDGL